MPWRLRQERTSVIKRIKKLLPHKKKEDQLPARITNDTVAAHRERVLAGGRKLKYPLQYTKHKLVRNTIIISFAALVAFIAFTWLQLYVLRDTGEWAYRVTRVAPVPVAQIDGEYVRYSDYLLYHRSTVGALQSQGRSDGDLSTDQLQFKQQQALDRALEDAYARKLARERNIAQATNDEVDAYIDEHRKESGMSEGSYEMAVSDYLHWTMDELRTAMKSTILRQEVAFAVDEAALKLTETISQRLQNGELLQDLAIELGAAVEYQGNVVVPKDNSDGGLSVAASKLEVGKVSQATKTLAGDGYYFIMRQAADDGSVGYSYLRVPLTQFKKEFDAIKDRADTKVFINIK